MPTFYIQLTYSMQFYYRTINRYFKWMVKPKINQYFVNSRMGLDKLQAIFFVKFTLIFNVIYFYSYTNDFKTATSMLREIIKFESENIGVFHNKKYKGKGESNKVEPLTIDDLVLENYRKQKDDYKKYVFKLLNIRREFSK